MSKTYPHLRKVTTLLSLLILALLVFSLSATSTSAKMLDPQEVCEMQGGTWDADNNNCIVTRQSIVKQYGEDIWLMAQDEFCNGDDTSMIIAHIEKGDYFYSDLDYKCFSSVRQNRECKLLDLEAASAMGSNHTLTATFKGYPAYLRLWNGSQFYRLPVVAGSTQSAGDGRWTAEFATADPLTGAPLAPAGNYLAMCFGPSGTAAERPI